MEERYLLDAAPITTVQGVRADEVQGSGNRTTAAISKEQQRRCFHPLSNQVEKLAGEIGPAPLSRSCVLVEGPHGIPVGSGDVGAVQRLDVQAADRGASFPSDALALAARKLPEEFVESRIAAGEPMILDAVTDQPSAPCGFGCASFVEEGDVGRGHLVLDGHGLYRGQQLLRSMTQ